MKRVSAILLALLFVTLVKAQDEQGAGTDPAKFLQSIESTTRVAGLNSAKKTKKNT